MWDAYNHQHSATPIIKISSVILRISLEMFRIARLHGVLRVTVPPNAHVLCIGRLECGWLKPIRLQGVMVYSI